MPTFNEQQKYWQSQYEVLKTTQKAYEAQVNNLSRIEKDVLTAAQRDALRVVQIKQVKTEHALQCLQGNLEQMLAEQHARLGDMEAMDPNRAYLPEHIDSQLQGCTDQVVLAQGWAIPVSADFPKSRKNVCQAALMAMVMLMATVLLTGCGSIVGGTISAANQIDQARNRSRSNSLMAQHLEDIKALQAKGDPLGDYLWAEANANKLIPDPITDPETLNALYQTAADRGSVDALIILAIQQFKEGGNFSVNSRRNFEAFRDSANQRGVPPAPSVLAALKRFEENPELKFTPDLEDLSILPKKEKTWRDALNKIDTATQKRCFFYWTYVFAPQQKRCLAPRIVADLVWPHFRDGGPYLKDKALRDEWYDKAIACEQTPAYQNAVRQCQVFGHSGQRVKD